MPERAGYPGIRGYEFDEDTAMPHVPADYDLFGQNPETDMLMLDRISEAVHLGSTALFPEREFIVRSGDIRNYDPLDDSDIASAARRIAGGQNDA